ncbi:mRNA splicing protein [Elasticomyces elasticus]|nr:mRNA splicing protein [Elasticomyces elasticus]
MPPPKKPTEPTAKNERNEYIPSFIAKKPFYIPSDPNADPSSADSDYLEHQRLSSAKAHAQDSLAQAQWYERGSRSGPAATKYRKGACENCGSLTHKAKECLSRKRKAGARWTGKNIEADEVVKEVKLGWDAKRDRWNGFEAKEFDETIEEYETLERLKREAAAAQKGNQILADDEENGEGPEQGKDEDGTKYEEETDMGRKQATSTRNLRLREDTAKYLLNLDLDSAKYDPKTRSMLEAGANPKASADNDLVAEEGFQRASGDAAEFERAQKYAWETQEKGLPSKLHLQANPTAGEVLRKKQLQETSASRELQRKALLDKYGGAEYLSSNPLKDTAVTENERYVEYDDHGKPKTKALPAATRKAEKSMYMEDVMNNNHTSVWGSWWKDFGTVKNSYCTGEAGRIAAEETEKFSRGETLALTAKEAAEEVSDVDARKDEETNERRMPNGTRKLQKAKRNEQVEEEARKGEQDEVRDSRKRRLDEMRSGVTDEQMEEYHRKRTAAADPMLKLLGRDELVG